MDVKASTGSSDDSPFLQYSHENFNMDDLDDESQETQDCSGDDGFLYECSFCKSSNQPCLHKMNGVYNKNVEIPLNASTLLNHSPTILGALQDYSIEESNNKFLASNYKKWLINLTPLK